MGRARKIARRSFLIGSVAIAGGVAFGAYMARRDLPNPVAKGLGEGEAALTPYVKITQGGVALITPRADKGQGAYAIQALLIAEELDIDPDTAEISPGVPDQVYYNAAVLEESVPFPSYQTGVLAETARAFMAVPAKLLGVQITGGSSTVPDSYEKLRRAGAVARETLKEAAAQREGLARADLTTQDGAVVLPDGRRIAYTELAAEAARIAPVDDVALRDPSEWRLLGKPDLKRRDIPAKSTGQQTYGIDLRMEGMLHAAVRINPGFGAGIASLDSSRAETMRGVQKIVPVTGGIGVLADNTWRAFQAVEAIDIAWENPAYPGESEAIFTELEAALGVDEAFDHRQRNAGDVEEALADGDVIEARYRVPYLAHAPMEPMNALVRVDESGVDIWTGTQIPIFVRDRAAKIADVGTDSVRVHVQPMGGSFGHRLEMTHVEQAVELALAVRGTPVKLTWSREEDFRQDFPRPASVAIGRGKVANGQIQALDLSVAQSALVPEWFGRLTGMPVPGPDATITAGSWDQPFAIPHYRVTGYRAPAMVPVSSWRSVGASGNGFYHDCFLDELIHAAGADPLEERLRLCLHEPSRKVLEAVGEMTGWDGPSLGEGRGRGVGFCLSFGVPCAQIVEVSQTPGGLRIDHVYAAADVGRVLDPVNAEAQLTGGVIFGLGHAMNCELTYRDHAPEQDNYHAYEGMRLYQAPPITTRLLDHSPRIRGLGEPGVPPAAPALANAIFAATGKRLREMPFNKHVDFL